MPILLQQSSLEWATGDGMGKCDGNLLCDEAMASGMTKKGLDRDCNQQARLSIEWKRALGMKLAESPRPVGFTWPTLILTYCLYFHLNILWLPKTVWSKTVQNEKQSLRNHSGSRWTVTHSRYLPVPWLGRVQLQESVPCTRQEMNIGRMLLEEQA